MSEPDPLQLRRIKISRQVNGLLNHYVGVIDAKASAFLAGNVAAGTFLLRDMPQPVWGRVLFFIALGSYAISVIMAGATIFPRLPKTGDSVLFWGDIAGTGSVKAYTQRFDAVLDSGQLDDQYIAQNFLTSRLLRRKFRCLRTAIAFFFVALFASFAVFLAAAK
ncbi:MAG: Pycsar system effector family protein [Chthoniobacteraceae bacterium]